MTSSEAPWLDRSMIVGPHMCLCLSQEAFVAAFKHLEIDQYPKDWIRTKQADATTHIADNPNGGLVAVVCLRLKPDLELISIYGLLAHEAVHIFQEWCDHFGEHRPSAEFEAYSIQHIAQQLMWSYDEQVKSLAAADPKLLY